MAAQMKNDPATYTDPSLAEQFVKDTGVDAWPVPSAPPTVFTPPSLSWISPESRRSTSSPACRW